jgi:hypothetical protein
VRKPIGIVHTLQLFHLLKGAEEPRQAVVEKHLIDRFIQPIDTLEWLRQRGYRGAVMVVPRIPGGGLIFGKKNQPAVYVANVGDTLIWDGEKVTVQ